MRLRALASSLLIAASASAHPAAGDCAAWPRWETFKQQMLSSDGRVIDAGTPRQYTVSEGQGYALFFALAANDPDAFERVLTWTENNLAAGDLSARLPAWQWGRRDDGSWGVLDENSASDSDLWIAYALTEAGRLWQSRRYRVMGKALGNRILREETALLPGLGRTLLPAPRGFTPAPGVWRLNPSYVPLQVLRRMAQVNPQWQELLASAGALLRSTATHGYSPDWAIYDAAGFTADAQTHGAGSYNAIRVYLWAGMISPRDPLRAPLLRALAPMARLVAVHGEPPESVDTATGVFTRAGPIGFSAALLPFLTASGETVAAAQQRLRAQALNLETAPGYYGSVLSLFGLGHDEKQFAFGADGALLPRWEHRCALPASRS